MARLDMFELDAKGIIPLLNETEEDFLWRGNRIIEMSKKITDDTLVKHFSPVEYTRSFSHFNDWFMFRKIALLYIKNNYGIDLSWVRIINKKFSLHPKEVHVVGRCYTAKMGNKAPVSFPVVSITYPFHFLETIIHELIHAARMAFIINTNRDIGFEEEVADDFYFRRFIANNHRTIYFLQVREHLKRYFGKKHGYVFIRLSPSEIMELLFPDNAPHSDPRVYLREMSKTSLRHWIMCQKLGLI